MLRLIAYLSAAVLLGSIAVSARDDGRYANSPLREWFDHLSSKKGRCCSDADGTALSDVEWKSKDGHYIVLIEGRWWPVPDEAVIEEPNRSGRTTVWPIYNRTIQQEMTIEIRCFIVGAQG